ncbi:MAG: putative transporter small subunit [Acinetobacter sp.]
MSIQFLTLYVLFWPLVATLILFLLCWAVYHDTQIAKANGEDLV